MDSCREGRSFQLKEKPIQALLGRKMGQELEDGLQHTQLSEEHLGQQESVTYSCLSVLPPETVGTRGHQNCLLNSQ